MNKITIIYICLFLLTSFTLFLGEKQTFSTMFIIIILLTAIIKGQLIIDYFMGLKEVELKYRLIVSIWLLLIISLIAIAFLIPM